MNKLCTIYNFAPHYRTSIFILMDKELHCDFVFGDSMSDVKKMDYSLLKNKVTETHTKHLFCGLYWQNIISLLFKDYDSYILLGESRALSTWIFCLLCRLLKPKKKIYLWTHGCYGRESRIESFIKKIEFKLANGGIFVYGNYARELMINKGFNPNKLHTIHNSLAYDQQINIRKELKAEPIYKKHFNNDNHNLFFVGRLTSVKKLDQLLDAMIISNAKGIHYNMTFIGGGTELEKLEQKVKDNGLQEQVWFYGPCYDEKELSSLIYNADLCVAPGNIGLTAMHSMVFGTPCITHNDFKWQGPEFEAIIPYKTGIFFKRNDVEDLSERINEWFRLNGNERDNVRKACMDEIDKWWNPHFQMEVLKAVLYNK